jgi:uncharacterized protein (TIGR00255 family)
MTGFATVRGRVGERQLLLEVKSVNHRFCEINARLPGKYSAWELPIQKAVRKKFNRGRIDIFLKEESGVGLSKIDHSQFKKAHQELKRLCRELKLLDDISLESVLHFKQNYFRNEERFDATSEWASFEPLFEKLLDRLAKMRKQEGQQLVKWFRQKLPEMQQLLIQLKKQVRTQSKLQEKKLKSKLEELGFGKIEEDTRIATEIAILADKLDVTEEIVRLEAHLKAFREILNEGELVGRKIDFLMQEVGREVNTIASKSQSSNIASCAVQFKTEVEKIREQAGNVE